MPKKIYPGPPLINKNALNSTKVEMTIIGNGIWGSYFYPLTTSPASNPLTKHQTGNTLPCQSLPLVQLKKNQVFPGIHYYAPWAVRAWPYNDVPSNLKPKNQRLQEWFEPSRRRAAGIVKQYYRPLPWLIQAVEDANPTTRNDASDIDRKPCLALHVRLTDKSGRQRKKLGLSTFLPYAEAFVKSGGESIFLATDDARVFGQMEASWPAQIVERIRMQRDAHRSTGKTAVFDMSQGKHVSNSEALIDIYAMSKCGFMVHGFSAMSEAAIYLNLQLHNQSVNLEDPNHMSAEQFRVLVESVMNP
jgi:hypothetical protein